MESLSPGNNGRWLEAACTRAHKIRPFGTILLKLGGLFQEMTPSGSYFQETTPSGFVFAILAQ